MTETNAKILLYGTNWCYSSRRARSLLDELSIPYEYIDIDIDMEGRSYVESVNRGFRSVPTILFPDGSLLVEPSMSELKEKLAAATQQE